METVEKYFILSFPNCFKFLYTQRWQRYYIQTVFKPEKIFSYFKSIQVSEIKRSLMPKKTMIIFSNSHPLKSRLSLCVGYERGHLKLVLNKRIKTF